MALTFKDGEDVVDLVVLRSEVGDSETGEDGASGVICNFRLEFEEDLLSLLFCSLLARCSRASASD